MKREVRSHNSGVGGVLGVFVVTSLLVACGTEETREQATDKTQGEHVTARTDEPVNETAPRSARTPEAEAVTARVLVVDLDDEPLAGVHPIATTAPNAFRAPAVTGPPTDAHGRADMGLPPNARLYIRAWDPEMRYFANNYFDMPPAEAGTHTALMCVVMVRSASLACVLIGADGRPAANTNVGLMMFHPTKGPWWPDEGDTDATGAIHFPAVPAGAYTLKLKALGAGMIDVPGVELPPGGHKNLGIIELR